MPIQCADIETLVQACLDDELAEEDARELKQHITDCAACRGQLAEEACVHNLIRTHLAPPRMPDMLRARILRALDSADAQDAQARDRSQQAVAVAREQIAHTAPVALGSAISAAISSWRHWALPGVATMAAAAALFLFVFVPQSENEQPVAYEAVRQHARRPPVEVQGTAASTWVRQHVSPQITVPRFSYAGTSLRGARLSHVRGRDAAQLYYDVRSDRSRHDLSVLIFDASDIDFARHFAPMQKRKVSNRVIWVGDSLDGYSVVAHKDARGIGYLVISDIGGAQLLDLVSKSDLLTSRGPR